MPTNPQAADAERRKIAQKVRNAPQAVTGSHLEQLAKAIEDEDYQGAIDAFTNYIHRVTYNESLQAFAMSGAINAIDPKAFDNTQLGEDLDPRSIFRDTRRDVFFERRFKEWFQSIPVTLREVNRQHVLLREARVPDFGGAILAIVRDAYEGGRLSSLTSEILVLADHVRRGKLGFSVIHEHQLIGLHFPLRVEDYPEVLTEDQAARFVSHECGVPASCSTIENRARERLSLRSPDGRGYVRENLRRAADEGFFDDRRRKKRGR